MPLFGTKRSKVYVAEEELDLPDDRSALPATPREARTAESLLELGPEPEPEPEPEPAPKSDKESRQGHVETVRRSSVDSVRTLTPSSTTSSLWQIYVEEDAATQIQKVARGRMVRQDMYAAELDVAIEIKEEEQEAVRLELERQKAAEQLAKEELGWAQLRTQFKQGTHARTADGLVGIVVADAEPSSKHVDLCLVNGCVQGGIILDTLSALTSDEIRALDDEELRLDQEFLAQERRNNSSIEAWVGLTRRSATYIIQSYARGLIARRALRKQSQAAVVIQSCARGMLCRLHIAEAATQEMRRTAAAVVIQATLRGHRARTTFRKHQVRVTSVQAAWRGYLCRAELRTARLEDLSRQFLHRMANIHAHAALQRWNVWVVETQRLRTISNQVVRRMRQAKVYQAFVHWSEMTMQAQEDKLAATVCLQAGVRGWLCRRMIAQCHAGVLLLQAATRGAAGRNQVVFLHRSATRIQALARGWSTRHRQAMIHCKATEIQRIWRGFRSRTDLMLQHSAATAIQAFERAVRLRRRYNKMRATAQHIQKLWRGYSCRQRLADEHASSLILQSVARCWRDRHEYTKKLEGIRQEQMREAAVRMQAIQRGRQQRKMQLVKQACARTVQGRLRDWIYRRRIHRAAIVIQSMWRGRQCRVCIREHRAAVILQQICSGTLRKRIFAGLRAATITVQSHRRRCIQVREYCKLKAAIKLQCHWRGRGARKLSRSWLSIKRIEDRGDEAFQRKWFEEAVLEYTKADELFEGDLPRLKCKRAAAFTGLGWYEHAVKDCDSCLTLHPNYYIAHRRRGTALYAMGKFWEAEQSYRACLDINQDDSEAAGLLARLTTVLELRKRARGDRMSQAPYSQLLNERAAVLSFSMERAWNMPAGRPQRVPRAVERMQEGARFHNKLADRGQSVYQLQIDVAGNYKQVKLPKSRPANGDSESTRGQGDVKLHEPTAGTEVLHLPPIGGTTLAGSVTPAA